MNDDNDRDGAAGDARRPWLTRAKTIRGLWWGGGIFLAVVTLVDPLVHGHAVFAIDGTFGFYSWYGLATCALMVVAAKALGIVLKRKDSYYEPDEP